MAFEVVIPRLGWSMEEGTFVGWLKRDGDTVQPGDALFELEGEKATQEIEAVDAGVLRIPPQGPCPGTVLKVGAVVGYLVTADEPPPWSTAAASPSTKSAAAVAISPAAAPSVRRLARESGVELASVVGSGRGGRIESDDIRQAATTLAGSARESATRPVASGGGRGVGGGGGLRWQDLKGTGARGRIRECDVQAAAGRGSSKTRLRIPITAHRRVISQRLTASRQQTVPVTITTRAEATNLVNLRDQFKSVGNGALVPSFQDLIAKLVAERLRDHRLLAGCWDEDAIVLPSDDEFHIGLAVDTEAGLLVPVLRDVGRRTIQELSSDSRRLIELARTGRLTAFDMQGGVFTITNLGAFGIETFTPAINLPESAILGLGAIRREPVVGEDGQLAARLQLPLSLTFDHRMIDGAPAARFLQDLAGSIANPAASLLQSGGAGQAQ